MRNFFPKWYKKGIIIPNLTNLTSDSQANIQTINLFNNLYQSDEILFGHQAELLVGANHPRGTVGSDTYDMIGKYPALYGYDLGNLEQGKLKNFSVLAFTDIESKTIDINAAGGVVTYNWRLDNPVVAGEDAKGGIVMGNITTLFNTPSLLSNFNGWLDNMVTYFLSLGNIPVIFRPFHECNASWFWWGKNGASDAEYIMLFQYVVDYFRSNGVHNLLYAYCVSPFASLDKFYARYPGDGYIDILSIDDYDDSTNKLSSLNLYLDAMITEGASRKKIVAVAETGYPNMPNTTWFTSQLYPQIGTKKIAYVMLWGNYGTVSGAFWSTYHGHPTEPDFVTFSQNSNIKFLDTI